MNELDSGVGGEKTEGEGALQTEDGSGQRKSSMQNLIQTIIIIKTFIFPSVVSALTHTKDILSTLYKL